CQRKAITMEESLPGILLARIDNDQCDGCGVCFEVCPGWRIRDAKSLKCRDRFYGPVLTAFLGHAVDPEIRRSSQSGGIATALLLYLLRAGKISRALVCRMLADGSLRPHPYMASEQDLQWSQGSLYCPVAVNSKLSDLKKGDKVAMVGLPCHVHGIWNLKTQNIGWQKRLPLIIGLICDRTLLYTAMDYLLRKGNVKRGDVQSLRFRDTSRGLFPENVSITNKDKHIVEIPAQVRVACKEAFTPARCRLCYDKLNTYSDITIGDAWGIKEDSHGYSSIIARTSGGLQVLLDAQKAKVIALEEIDPERVVSGQHLDHHRKIFTAYTKAWNNMGRSVPQYGMEGSLRNELTVDADICWAKREVRWHALLKDECGIEAVVRRVERRLLREKLVAMSKRFTPRRILAGFIRRTTGHIKKSKSMK
ncbi:MAG: Coenzyme F420 hydrogenase/dehydrogenase, beta subunit C-terminal domain, partial [Deltaproteobacteria bacterium]|nr:Coenzyme F420 hydrogenase/dehydrogenase, beta subunit C-terminal domain [Deltaproteobacteria bacterium]